MISQPENLSKDRLKAELKKKGIPHSPGRTKEYYVKIYHDSVLAGSVGRRLRPRSEFSSDEETITKRLNFQQETRGKQYTKVLNIDHFVRQISDYSDSQLASELRKYGIDAGPITATTRSLYQKKLAKSMLENSKKVPISQSSSGVTVACESDNELSSDYEKEDVDSVKPSPYQRPPIKPSPYQRPPIPKVQPQPVPVASSYNFRPRPSSGSVKPSPKPVSTVPKQPLIPRGGHTVSAPPPSSSTAPIRPYSATWCHIRLFANLLILLLVFIVAVVGFDFMLYGESRVVNWLVARYPSLANITDFI